MSDVPDDARRDPPQAEPRDPSISAESLFAGRREVIIEHKGECYRLRLTRRGRLILTK